MVGAEIDCPGCSRVLRLRTKASAEAELSRKIGDTGSIVRGAGRFTIAAALLLVIGLLIAVVGALQFIIGAVGDGINHSQGLASNESAACIKTFIIAGGFIALAFGPYLIAQLLHIRALLTRK